MSQDLRRNDMGSKIMTGVIVFGITLLVGLWVRSVDSRSYDGIQMGYENSKEIATVKAEILTSMSSMSTDINEIKTILTRRIPERH